MLFRVVVRHQFAHAEQREHASFATDVQPGRHLREVARRIDIAADDRLHAAVALHQAATVGESALAKHVKVARFVHDLRDEVHARFVIVGRYLRDPLAGHVPGDEFDFGDERCELAFCPLYLVGQRLDRRPGDIRGGGPLARDRFFVQLSTVAQPDVCLRAHGVVADARNAAAGNRTARAARRVAAFIRDFGGQARIDILELEAAPAVRRIELASPDVFAFEPAKVVAPFGAVFLIGLERVFGSDNHVDGSPAVWMAGRTGATPQMVHASATISVNCGL